MNAEEAENVTPVSVEAKRPRRWMKVILTLVLSGRLGGFLVSYVFSPKYTSESTVLVEGNSCRNTDRCISEMNLN